VRRPAHVDTRPAVRARNTADRFRSER
jgi:hypothetical protein